jgi:hypothetical protein
VEPETAKNGDRRLVLDMSDATLLDCHLNAQKISLYPNVAKGAKHRTPAEVNRTSFTFEKTQTITDLHPRFAYHLRRYIHAYSLGLYGSQAPWATRKYRGHHVLPENLLRELVAGSMDHASLSAANNLNYFFIFLFYFILKICRVM